jgi:uncharacterized protein (DUF983 family)
MMALAMERLAQEPERSRPGPLVLLGRAARLRCPHCGRGAMFRGWFSLTPACAGCGLSFERDEQDDYWLGAYFVNFIVTEVVFAAFVLLVLAATWPDPWWPLLWWGGAAQMIVTPILFYPFSKALWLGGDLMFRPGKSSDFNRDRDTPPEV